MSSPLVRPTNKLPSHVMQPVAATVLVPQTRALTLVARKAHIVMIALAQKQAGDSRAPTAGFVAPLRDILIHTGSSEATRPLLKRYLEQMMHTLVEYRPVDLDSVVVESRDPSASVELVDNPIVSEERIFPLLAEVRIVKRRAGDLWVQWWYPPSIIDEIIKPTRWSVVNLDVIRALRTYAAVMLYLLCVRYQSNPGGVTKRYTVKEMDLMLRSRPEKKDRTWRRLKTDVIKAAIAEVNDLSDIRIELVEYKHGREVTHAQFTVAKHALVGSVPAGPVDVTAVTLAAGLGIPEHQVDDLEREFGAARVRDGLERVERFVQANPSKRPGNAVKYVRATIENAVAEGKAPPPGESVIAVQLPTEPSVEAALEQQRRDQGARAYAAIEAEFREQAVAQQADWTHRYAASLAPQHPFRQSKLTQARLASGQWQSATIKHAVLGFYAVQTHGDGWVNVFSAPVATPL